MLLAGQNVRPLSRREYILDVATEMERVDPNYTFWCRRVIWMQPLKFDNELYVTAHYNQVRAPGWGCGELATLPLVLPGPGVARGLSCMAAALCLQGSWERCSRQPAAGLRVPPSS